MKAIRLSGIMILLMAAVACSDKNSGETNEPNSEMQERVFPVRIQTIKNDTIERTLEYTANLVAFKEIHYAPASPGRIKSINVEVGSRVQKGDILVEIDKTQLNQALTQYANAVSSFNRIDTLYKLGSISEQQYEQTKTQYELAELNVDFIKENTTLTSPINGIVTGKYYENGEMYSGAPNTAAGKAAILSLMQINPVKAIVSVSESYFPLIRTGMATTIRTDVYNDEAFTGKVYKIYPVIDQTTRTFQVEIVIDNNSEKLRPGMFARIELILGDAEALVVPAISVLKQEGTNNRFIFIADHDKARQIFVKTGRRFDDQIEILSEEIKEGMKLITDGQASLLDGSKIEVVTD